MKSALILPAALLCLTACKKEEVVTLKKQAAQAPAIPEVDDRRLDKQDEEGPALDYMLAISMEEFMKKQLSTHEAMLLCPDSEMRSVSNTNNKDEIRTYIQKCTRELAEETAKRQTAQATYLKSNPPPEQAAKLEAHAAELGRIRNEINTLQREIYPQGWAAPQALREKVRELEMQFIKFQTKHLYEL